MEGLVEVGDNFKVLPNLAEKWDISADGLTYTFTLKNTKWSDGVPVKAKDFVFSWKRVLTKKSNAPYSSYLYPVKNAKNYFDGKISDFNQVGVKAVNDNTLVISLEKPVPYFIYVLTFWPTYPLREDHFTKFGKKAFAPSNFIGTGPYVLKEKTAQKVVLEKNKNFWGEAPKVDKIEMYYLATREAERMYFKNGNSDVLVKATNEDILELKKFGRLESFYVPQISFLEFNFKSPFFNNINLRKAFAHGFDRADLVRKLGNGKPTKFLVPSEMSALSSQNGIEFNSQNANRFYVLTSDIAKGKVVELCTAGSKKTAEAIIETLKLNKSWNIEYKLTMASTEQIATFKKQNKCDFYYSWWIADYPDPENFLAMFSSEYNGSITNYRSTKFDDYLKIGVGTLAKTDREKFYSMAEKTLLEEDVAIVPMYFSKEAMMLSKKIKNFYYAPLGYLYLKYAEVN